MRRGDLDKCNYARHNNNVPQYEMIKVAQRNLRGMQSLAELPKEVILLSK